MLCFENNYNDNTYLNISVRHFRSDLQAVQIEITTSTYDQIEKDLKITTEAALGLIGRTMGLFTGFSVLSAVELLYFVVKYVIYLRK